MIAKKYSIKKNGVLVTIKTYNVKKPSANLLASFTTNF